MFEHVAVAPPDAIFGLAEAFRKDPSPRKINLVAGVYKNEEGRTPVLRAVKEAERRIWESESGKGYLPIDGSPKYGEAVRQLLFGGDHAILTGRRAVTAHAPGGTGALRVACELLKRIRPETTVWLSEPTWPNHPQLCDAVGLAVATYPYFDRETNGLACDRMIDALQGARKGDVVLLHGCCHNPTGVDPTPEQWQPIGDLLAERGALPLIDFAYQGFAVGLDEDAASIRALCERVPEAIVCSSFSKNLGLYNERVGALTAVAASEAEALAVQSQVKSLIRANYSNPPAHGSAIVTTVLNDAGLRREWLAELEEMRQRVRDMRRSFAQELDRRGVSLDPSGNDFIARQRGLFSFSGLDREQVTRLRSEHSVYIVGSGRINVAGMTTNNMSALCDAIAAVA